MSNAKAGAAIGAVVGTTAAVALGPGAVLVGLVAAGVGAVGGAARDEKRTRAQNIANRNDPELIMQRERKERERLMRIDTYVKLLTPEIEAIKATVSEEQRKKNLDIGTFDDKHYPDQFGVTADEYGLDEKRAVEMLERMYLEHAAFYNTGAPVPPGIGLRVLQYIELEREIDKQTFREFVTADARRVAAAERKEAALKLHVTDAIDRAVLERQTGQEIKAIPPVPEKKEPTTSDRMADLATFFTWIAGIFIVLCIVTGFISGL